VRRWGVYVFSAMCCLRGDRAGGRADFGPEDSSGGADAIAFNAPCFAAKWADVDRLVVLRGQNHAFHPRRQHRSSCTTQAAVLHARAVLCPGPVSTIARQRESIVAEGLIERSTMRRLDRRHPDQHPGPARRYGDRGRARPPNFTGRRHGTGSSAIRPASGSGARDVVARPRHRGQDARIGEARSWERTPASERADGEVRHPRSEGSSFQGGVIKPEDSRLIATFKLNVHISSRLSVATLSVQS